MLFWRDSTFFVMKSLIQFDIQYKDFFEKEVERCLKL